MHACNGQCVCVCAVVRLPTRRDLCRSLLYLSAEQREREWVRKIERKNSRDDRLNHSPCFILLNSFDHVGHVVQITDEIVFSDQNIAVKGSNDRSQSREANADEFFTFVKATSLLECLLDRVEHEISIFVLLKTEKSCRRQCTWVRVHTR